MGYKGVTATGHKNVQIGANDNIVIHVVQGSIHSPGQIADIIQ